jgi:hypothetical protein
MALNIITDQTAYVTFTKGGTSTNIVKMNVTDIQADSDEGRVYIMTNGSPGTSRYKNNARIELVYSQWAPSTAQTTPYASVAALLSDLLTKFSSKW